MTEPAPTNAIVVGVDGSPPSEVAVEWAATQAVAEGSPLVLLHAAATPAPESAAWLAAHGIDHLQIKVRMKEEARALLRHCDARVRTAHPGLDVHRDVQLADPRDALLDAGAEAAMVVVGTRGLGLVRRLVLGSVASTVVKHATRPTVVVRAEPPDDTTSGVLVGIAGETEDAALVDLAFRVAAPRGLPVTAFHCLWDVVGVDEERTVGPDEPGYEGEWALLDAALAPSIARHPEVEVHRQLSRGFADERLIEASHHAATVVVGHRRKPFLNELIYGSAAPLVVEHARCTVVVVPFTEP